RAPGRRRDRGRVGRPPEGLASRRASGSRPRAGGCGRSTSPPLAGLRRGPCPAGVSAFGAPRPWAGGRMILAIESASTDPSVAVAERDGQPLAVDGWSGGPGQGRELLPRLLAAIDRAERDLSRTTAVAVGIGPGSLTGLRVGMSLAKGLAFGLGVPIVGIPSLAAWLVAEQDACAALAWVGAHQAFVPVPGT